MVYLLTGCFASDQLPNAVPESLRPPPAAVARPVEVPEPPPGPAPGPLGPLPPPSPDDTDAWTSPSGMVFRWVPPGAFTMGSPPTEAHRSDVEGPQHRVNVDGFWLTRTEVTQGQYEQVMGTRPSTCRKGCGDFHPVHDVSWLEAIRFLVALSEQDGLSPCYELGPVEAVSWPEGAACTGYRLPTEAEWEYAARAGTTTPYSFGDDVSMLAAYAWYGENSDGTTHPVGQKQPNPLGLYDLYGNVREWVWDAKAPYPGASPAGPRPRDARLRMVRGGGYGHPAWVMRSAHRDWGHEKFGEGGGFGFRCVRSSLPE